MHPISELSVGVPGENKWRGLAQVSGCPHLAWNKGPWAPLSACGRAVGGIRALTSCGAWGAAGRFHKPKQG